MTGACDGADELADLRSLVADLRRQVEELAGRVDGYDRAFALLADQGSPPRRHLSVVPGDQR